MIREKIPDAVTIPLTEPQKIGRSSSFSQSEWFMGGFPPLRDSGTWMLPAMAISPDSGFCVYSAERR